jgi:hypothetical protein
LSCPRGGRPAQLDTSHAFTKHEWKLVRVVGKVVLPLLARAAFDRYLVQRGLPVTPSK